MLIRYKVLAVSGSKIIIEIAHIERTFDIDGFLEGGVIMQDEPFKHQLLNSLLDECNTYRHNKRLINIFERASDEYNGKLRIPCNAALKVMLWNELLKRQMTWSELGKMVDLNVTQMSRIANFRYASKVEMIEKCLNALDLDVKCSVG